MDKAVVDSEQRVVSSESEELILVDEDDNETGFLSKALAHDGAGALHRAFSIFLFNKDGELLLQKRASSKRLWPQYWSNSCCSHPRRGETIAVATSRRLRDELNVEAELEYLYKFSYQAGFGDLGSEHELCHVYLGSIAGEAQANEYEIESLRFVGVADLESEFAAAQEQFTPWFLMEWQTLRKNYGEKLRRYAALQAQPT